MRITMLFAGPFEDDIDWKLIAPDPSRPPGAYGWLGRVWRAVTECVQRSGSGVAGDSDGMRRETHRTVKGVTEDLERFRFNTAISKLMTLTNAIREELDAGGCPREACERLAQMLAPMAPFLAEELWRETLGHPESVHTSEWPSFDPALVAQQRATLVVQVEGKVRDKIEVDADASENECRELALASEKARRVVGDAEVTRVIVRAPRLANIVTAR
jgi:leucyl-tRNA synthetase